MPPTRMNPDDKDQPAEESSTGAPKKAPKKAAAKKTATKRSTARKVPAKKTAQPRKATAKNQPQTARGQDAGANDESVLARSAGGKRAAPTDSSGKPPDQTDLPPPWKLQPPPTPGTGQPPISPNPPAVTWQPSAPRPISRAAGWSDRYASGIINQPWAVTFGLLASWTGLIIALWAAFFGLFAGALVAVGIIASNNVTRQLFNAGAGESVGALGVFAGALAGAGGSFVAIYSDVLFGSPAKVFVSIVTGFILALVLLIGSGVFEGDYLRLVRGYRNLSTDEVRRVAPLVQDAAGHLGLSSLPNVAMATSLVPSAWCHPRHLVLTPSLLTTLTDSELEAVLAHELWHWREGHAIALTFVACCSWPITLVYNLASWLGGYTLAEQPTQGKMSVGKGIVWFFFWPSWILTRFIIGPAAAARQRRFEYEADAAANQIGLGSSLAAALYKLTQFEGGRTGFEAIIAAAHPPTELRLDRLRPAAPDAIYYTERPLGVVTPDRLKWAVGLAAAAIAIIISVGSIVNHLEARGKELAGFSQDAPGAEQAGATFVQDLLDDASNATAANDLIDNTVAPDDQATVLAQYQPLAAISSTGASEGVHATITAQTLGCTATLTNNNGTALVDLHEMLVVHGPPAPNINVDDSAAVALQWSSVGWQVTEFSVRALGTGGLPTTFGSCPK